MDNYNAAIKKNIDLEEYDYDLPDDRIAQYPLDERDMSQLLIYKGEKISKDVFRSIDDYLPSDSLLVFNNTRVIRARLIFRKDTGAEIEIFCLEPHAPSEYESSFKSFKPVEWICIIGNLKKWKRGLISASFFHNDTKYTFSAEKLSLDGDKCRVGFSWDCPEITFGDLIEIMGHVPLPPYINRKDEVADVYRYQTVYSSIKGSVAAPTAGLHFTDQIIKKLKDRGHKPAEITLHVGAGTFQPIKSKTISDHIMHCEHFSVTKETIELLLARQGRIIAVGTTSVRTLESLYWIGVKLCNDPSYYDSGLSLGQWEPYNMNSDVPVKESMKALLLHLSASKISEINAITSIMIVPGYNFRMINGLITNFHQPKSTLLLLISAWTGKKWNDIYTFALENNFRFLSYGDSSILF
jgi:S-adenosylmethionine:tRNA ribosyltransferase-isomerase